jgi:hypothetical protein
MRTSLAILALLVVVGCSVGPTPQEEYDAAMKNLDRLQERLDALRPAYDLAQQKAALQVCTEITGTTPDESAGAALEQLEGIMNQAADAQAAADQSADKKPVGDVDDAIDKLMTAQKTINETQAAISAPLQQTSEVMRKIHTPDTPEAKRYEEVLAGMPEVKAYKRQEDRVARAEKAADAAEAKLNAAAKQ